MSAMDVTLSSLVLGTSLVLTLPDAGKAIDAILSSGGEVATNWGGEKSGKRSS